MKLTINKLDAFKILAKKMDNFNTVYTQEDSDYEKLDSIELKTIEKYLREKKLKNINGTKNN